MLLRSWKHPAAIAASVLSVLWLTFGFWCWTTVPLIGSTLDYLLALGTFGLYPVVAWLLGWPIYSGPLTIKPPAEDSSGEGRFYRAFIAALGAGALCYAAWELSLAI